MSRFPEEWLDAKLANIRRWKAAEAERSAKINASSAVAPTRKGGVRALLQAPAATAAAAAPINSTTSGGVESRHAQGNSGERWVLGNEGCKGTSEPSPSAHSGDARVKNIRPCTGIAGVAPGPLTINAARADAATDRADAGTTAGQAPPAGADAAKGGTKYRNQRTDGYASKREAKRATALRLMQEAGQIQGLREQVEFLLIPRQTRPDGTAERSCSYWADFVYDEWAADGWRRVVEDVKGVRTREYVLKRKLMLMVHGVAIREV